MGDVAALTWPLTRPGGLLAPSSARARRCLFGPPNHDFTQTVLEKDINEIQKKDKLRWNFDFDIGRPLPGKYKWETLGDPSDADSNGGSVAQNDEKDASAKKEEQTQITDFMRKRKSSSQKDSLMLHPKTRRRSST